MGAELKGGGHAAVENVTTEAYSDVEVELDFQFQGSSGFNLTFNQDKFKGSHAGHICRAVVRNNSIILRDGLTGVFQNDIFEARKAKKETPQMKALLKTKESIVKHKFQKGKWYHLLVRVQGDKMTFFLDGKKVNELRSEGVAHATKNKLGIVTPGQAMYYDNLKILVP